MDRVWGIPRDDRERIDGDPSADVTLESRADAIAQVRDALEAKAGPVLITGEAGVGKSWLWQRLRFELGAPWRWVGVDLAPANDPNEIHGLIGHALGLPHRGSSGESRLELADFLEDAAADGERWVLVVDEAQSVDPRVLDEIRILANRLGRPGGFSGLLVVGQTALVRRLATRPLEALSVRLSAHIHLRPIDVDETRTLLEHRIAERPWELATIERIHRDASGNPRKILTLAGRVSARAARPDALSAAVAPPPVAPAKPQLPADWDRPGPILGPPKPPLRVEEGLIEVGWEPGSDSETGLEDATTNREIATPRPARPSLSEETEEPIDDHYAALQAWTEWAHNQGRAAGAESSTPAQNAADPIEDPEPSEEPADAPSNVWADGQQSFAPYSQLFSRLRQPKDTN